MCIRDSLNTSTSQPIISVVIVDDDRLQGQLLNEMLRRIDGVQFDITTTIHADEAIRIAVEKNPHIVFTDIEMPEMNGSEIMCRIRSASSATSATDKPVRRTKFVAMTAHEQSIMPQLRSDGFDACLFKPFSVQTLAATICQLTGIAVRVLENSKLTIAGEAENNSKLKTQNSKLSPPFSFCKTTRRQATSTTTSRRYSAPRTCCSSRRRTVVR